MSHVHTARPRSQASPAAAVALDFGLRVRIDGHANQRTLFSGAENLSGGSGAEVDLDGRGSREL